MAIDGVVRSFSIPIARGLHQFFYRGCTHEGKFGSLLPRKYGLLPRKSIKSFCKISPVKFLLKYSSEIALKSDRTKRRLMHILYENLKEALGGLDYSIRKEWFGMVVEAPDEAIHILRRVFGIEIISPVEEVQFQSLEELLDSGKRICQPLVSGRTFAVRSTRTGKHEFSSRDVERKLGALLVEYGRVDLTNPDITCHVEIKGNRAFIYTQKIRGEGGFPVGSEGKVLALLSGGIDSAVAVWYAYRMGLDVDFLFFDLGGEQKAIAMAMARYLKSQWGYGSRGRFIYVPFTRVVAEIMKVRPSYRNLMLKYAFYQVAERVARERNADALLTGESIGQVSTQTLRNLALLDRTIQMLVVRPLASMRKSEIMDMARRIGTYDLAYKGKEYCAISRKNVETHGKLDKLLREKEKMDWGVVENLNPTILPLDEMGGTPDVEDIEGRDIIDLRSEGDPIEGATRMSLEEAVSSFHQWDRGKRYLIVCEKGMKSALLAEMMRDAGFDAISMSQEQFFQIFRDSRTR